MKSPKRKKALEKHKAAGKLTDAQIDMLLRCGWIDQDDAGKLKKKAANG